MGNKKSTEEFKFYRNNFPQAVFAILTRCQK